MRRAAIRLALAASLLPAAQAHAVADNAGTTGFGFLKVGVGARASALGAYTAVSGDLESTAWNPAGLCDVGSRAASMSLTRYLVDTEAGFLGLALPHGERMWALSVNYFTYGELDRTDADGAVDGTFGAFDVATAVTASQRLWHGRLTLGASLKAVYSSIDDYTSDAYAVDLGLLTRGPVPGMALGASIANLGTVRSGYTRGYEDSLPVLLRAGVSHRPAHFPVPMLLAADVTVPNDNDPYATFGAEIRVAGGLYVRPGYSLQQGGPDGNEAMGLSTGAGLVLKGMRLDYAFASYPGLGDVHRVSISGRI